MKFFIDENLSEDLAVVLNHIARMCRERHTVAHAIEVNGRRGVPDIEWMEKLAGEGNWIIVSKDKFKKGRAERIALESSGLTFINLGTDWRKKNGIQSTIQLVRWWPTISRDVLNFSGPTLCELPWGLQDKLQKRRP